MSQFLSTLSLRRATHYDNYNLHCTEISIHALLAESDPAKHTILTNKISISIHALLAESDYYSMGGHAQFVNFYPRSPCGERLNTADQEARKRLISIHALLAESDQSRDVSRQTVRNFYPRSPCGERPFIQTKNTPKRDFYPRSPCGERQTAHALPLNNITFLSTLSLRRATVGRY